MARPRFRVGRIVAVFVLFLILCLLLELNRFLPGGWPGGGGDGGFRRAGTVDLQDVPGTPDAERPGRTRMTEADERPPVEVPHDGVVIEIRTPDGRYSEQWRFGLGVGGSEDVVGESTHGRHVSRDRRLAKDGFRVRTGGGALRVRPDLARTKRGHWIVVAPPNLPSAGRKRTSFEITFRATWGTSRIARIERADGSVQDMPIGKDGTLSVKKQREPFRVTPIFDGVEGRAVWIAQRTPTPITLASPPQPTEADAPTRDRIVLLPSGAMGFVARFAGPALGSGEQEPTFHFAHPEGEAGASRSLRVPKGVAVDLLVDDPVQRPYSMRIAPGAATVEPAYEAHAGASVPVRVLDASGKPVKGAFVVAGVSADPFLTLRYGTTDAEGRVTLTGLRPGALGVFVAAAEQGFATQRVLMNVTAKPVHEVRLAPGRPLAVVVVDPQGLPISGALVDVEPEGDGAPVASAPRPTGGVLPEVSLVQRRALGWTPAHTDTHGRWQAEGLGKGRYRVRIQADGYERATVEAVEAGTGRTWFVTLVPKQG